MARSSRRSPQAPPEATSAAPAVAVGSVTGLLLRFISCGLLSLAAGGAWRLTLAPARIGVGSALSGIMILLVGFVVAGGLWYLRDARVRLRDPARVADERIVFSFVVFVVVPLAVLLLIAVVWCLALLVGA